MFSVIETRNVFDYYRAYTLNESGELIYTDTRHNASKGLRPNFGIPILCAKPYKGRDQQVYNLLLAL